MPNKIRSSTFKTKNINDFPVEDFFNQVFDSLQNYSIFTIDTNLIINSWNQGASNIFKYEPSEILNSHFEVIYSEEDRKNGVPASTIDAALSNGKAVDNRWHVRKDGTRFYAQGQVFPVRSISAELIGFVKILRDLTENKLTEDAINKYITDLEELNEHKDNILAILSHDLRSPLTRIVAISNYLLSDFDVLEPEEFKNLLQHLNKAAIEELNMLDYLLEWARIKYASQAFNPGKIDIFDSVTKAFEILRSSAVGKNVKLENNINENTQVFADGKMLLSIIQNIVSNAIRHSQDGSIVSVSANLEKDDMVIAIKDTGAGMSEDIQQKLFSPNLETLSSIRKKNKGGGIGMLLTKSFVEANGGKIWVESVEGSGSTFYFSLPVNPPSPVDFSGNRLDFSDIVVID